MVSWRLLQAIQHKLAYYDSAPSQPWARLYSWYYSTLLPYHSRPAWWYSRTIIVSCYMRDLIHSWCTKCSCGVMSWRWGLFVVFRSCLWVLLMLLDWWLACASWFACRTSRRRIMLRSCPCSYCRCILGASSRAGGIFIGWNGRRRLRICCTQRRWISRLVVTIMLVATWFWNMSIPTLWLPSHPPDAPAPVSQSARISVPMTFHY